MQNNVTELTQRLLRSLDSNYNVIDMPAVIDIISLLEKVAITKELLETTRLGKHINELRRKTTNESLSKRAKGLLKKWRSMVLPDSNGQIKTSPPLQQQIKTKTSPPLQQQQQQQQQIIKSKISPPLQQQISQITKSKVSPPLQQQISQMTKSKISPPLQQLLPVKSPKTSPPLVVPPQIKTETSPAKVSPLVSPSLPEPKPLSPILPEHSSDVNLNQVKTKKRPAKEALDNVNAKRARVNGGLADLDFSDNSSCSFKDVVIPPNVSFKPESVKREVIVINSDSNSSFPENRVEPQLEQQMPKKRGRKKGSKNHKNLIDEAESSFTNKLAVSASRGNSKVKTTQELLASIQNKNSAINVKPKEDLIEKAAKLTERVQVIDQKLNTNANRNKNSQKGKLILNQRNDRVIESGSVINDKSLLSNAEDEIVVVDDIEPEIKEEDENDETEIRPDDVKKEECNAGSKSLSVEEALALLPPVDKSVLYETDEDQPRCTCFLKENKSDFSILEEGEEDLAENAPKFEFIEDQCCPAKKYLTEKYHTDSITEEMVHRLHTTFIHSVNGIYSLGPDKPDPPMLENGLYVNVVPNYYETLDKDPVYFDSEDYKKYRVSNDGDSERITSDNVIIKESDQQQRTATVEGVSEEKSVFREWYECAEKPCYGGEVLKILPYTIID